MKSSVVAIIFSPDCNQVLLTKRRDVPIWVLPGGGIDPGENPQEAVVREVFEETGLNVAIHRKTGTYFPLNRLANLTLVFECKILSGTPKLSSETNDISYFQLSQLPKYFFPIHEDWLNDALKNPNKSVQKPIFQATYCQVFKFFFKHPILVIRSIFSRIGLPINT